MNKYSIWQQKKQTTTTKKSVYNQQNCPIRNAESSLLATQVLATQTLCDPVDCSLLGFSAQGIFQARTLEWVAISFLQGSSPPRDQTRGSHVVACIAGGFFTIEPWGSLWDFITCQHLMSAPERDPTAPVIPGNRKRGVLSKILSFNIIQSASGNMWYVDGS